MYLDDVGQLVRDLRRKQGLSLNAVAKQAGISNGTLSTWENNSARPRVSELLRVLEVLKATPEKQREILERLGSKGAVQHLQGAESRPSIGGNLLRIMRVRQHLTQEEVARKMGMTQSLLAKWERSEAWPSDERLHQLCWVLNAHPEELEAILACRFAPSPLPPKKYDLEALRNHAHHLDIIRRNEETAPLFDLHALSLLAELKQRAHFDPEWAEGASYWQGSYGVILFNAGRHTEAQDYAEEALGRHGGDWSKQNFWLDSLMIRVMKGANAKGNKARSALSLIHSVLPHVRDYQYRAWMLGEMAYALVSLGEGRQAFYASEKGVQEAEESGIPLEVQNRQSDSLNILIASGDIAGISRYLNLHGTHILDFGEMPSTRGVSVVKALLTLGDIASATRVRKRIDAWLASLNAAHSTPNWDTIFSTTPAKVNIK